MVATLPSEKTTLARDASCVRIQSLGEMPALLKTPAHDDSPSCLTSTEPFSRTISIGWGPPSPASEVLARRGVALSDAIDINGDTPREDNGDPTDEKGINGDAPSDANGDPTEANWIKGDAPREANELNDDGAQTPVMKGSLEPIPARPLGSRKLMGLLKTYR